MLNKQAIEHAGLSPYHFLEDIAAIDSVQTITLFGSRVRGDANMRADIDLAITGDKLNTKTKHQIKDMVEQADTLLAIDCIFTDDLHNEALHANIAKEGVLIYERSTH